MNDTLNNLALDTSAHIIDICRQITFKTVKWTDLSDKPFNVAANECAGFINNPDDYTGVSTTVDVILLADKHLAVARTYCVQSIADSNGVERYNNLQFDYDVDYDIASTSVIKGSNITLSDIQQVLNTGHAQLKRLIVSNQSGVDTNTGQKFGARYDVALPDESQSEEQVALIKNALKEVLSTIQNAANTEVQT